MSRPGDVRAWPLRPAASVAWLSFFAVCLVACDKHKDGPTEPATSSAPAATSPSAPAGDDEADIGAGDEPPRPDVLVEEARIDVDGILYGLAIDGAGNVLAATREGRPAAYLFTPDRDPMDATPASIDLSAAVSTVVALGDGAFGLVMSGAAGVVVARPGGDLATEPLLEVAGELSIGGRTADVAIALGQLWILTREPEGDRGLVAMPLSADGERTPTARLLTGPSPVQLAVMPGAGPAEERLAVVILKDGRGELMLVRPPDGEPDGSPTGTVERLPFDGMPVGLVAPTADDPHVWVRRHGTADLLPIRVDGDAPVLGTAVELPFVPNRVYRIEGEPPTFVVAHGDGRLARVGGAEDGDGPRETTLGQGTVELAALGPYVLAADPSAAELVALDAATLERRFAIDLEYPPGRVVVDAARQIAWVTVPTRQQVVRVRVHPPTGAE